VFSSFVVFGSLVDAIALVVYLKGTTEDYWLMFTVTIALQYLLEMGVASELLSEVVDGARQPGVDNSKTRTFIVIWLTMIMSVGLLSVIFATFRNVFTWGQEYLQVDLGVGLLRAVIFALVLCTLWIYGVRWNSLVTQVTVSMSFFYCVDLVCEIMLEMEARSASPYQHFFALEAVRTAAWCIVMVIVSLCLITRHRYLSPAAGREIRPLFNDGKAGLVRGRRRVL
jgi:hypothetical protein